MGRFASLFPHSSYVGRLTLTYLASVQGDSFPGLIPLVEAFLETLDVQEPERRKFASYLNLIRSRANGKSTILFSFVSVAY